MIMTRKILTISVAAIIALLAGCHTMDGLGQDIERGGQKMQDKANK
jgi:predicted small secreted protein